METKKLRFFTFLQMKSCFHTDTCPYTMGSWEPTTFIFRGYNSYIGGVKPSFFMVLGSKGSWYNPFPLRHNLRHMNKPHEAEMITARFRWIYIVLHFGQVKT